jgi:predicted nucleotidyltransferase
MNSNSSTPPKSYDKLKKKWYKIAEERRHFETTAKQRLLNEGVAVFEKYGIEKVVIFGSLTEQRFGEKSDIDIFVRYLSNDKFWEFKRVLEEAVGLPIDLYTDKDEKTFVQKIMSRGEVIYEV